MKGNLVKTILPVVMMAAMFLFADAADKEKHYELKVGDFSQLVVDDSFNVEYRSDNDKEIGRAHV